ncbi:Siderophore-interacting protein (fragment) [Mesorhizobium sp. STM 4661]
MAGGMTEADWHLFAGDETALPAIARMLEALPRNACGEAFIEVADEREIQPIASNADIEVKWLCRNGAEAGAMSRQAVEQARFPDSHSSVHAWVGCEYDAFRAIRSHRRQIRCLKKHEHLAVSYWRRGEAQA